MIPDLQAIEARANAATEGPWYSDAENIENYTEGDVSVWHKDPSVNGGIVFNVGEMISAVGYACNKEREDADFIAHARTDIPQLCAEVRRLQEENARLYHAANGMHGATINGLFQSMPSDEWEKREADRTFLQLEVALGYKESVLSPHPEER